MRRNGGYPVPPPVFGPAPHRHPDPNPTDMIAGELPQIRAYHNYIQNGIRFPEDRLGPSFKDEVDQEKSGLRNSLRALERLQQSADNAMNAAMLNDMRNTVWGIHESVVRLEARLKEADPERPETYVPTGARQVMVAEARPDFFVERNDGPSSRPMPMGTPANVVQPERVRQFRSIEGALGRSDSRMYPTSGALLRGHQPVFDAGHRNVELQEDSSTLEESSSDAATNLYTNYSPDAIPRKDIVHPVLTKTWNEVQQDCLQEENMATPILNDPDRRRTGSVPSYFATFAIMARLNDPDYYLPRLLHIQKREVQGLKACLEERNLLQRTGNISRIEKLLHLLFLLQDGIRFETIAVMFSRTPRQVQASCDRVFEGLLQLHSDTAMAQVQPTCYQLWQISLKYLAADAQPAQHAERYYGWRTLNVVKVLVTVNLFIGRYREQGRVALDGPYSSWWRECPGTGNLCPEQ
jgi:hypothetical protein